MKQKYKIIFFVCIFYSSICVAQKQITKQNLAWYGYYISFHFNDKWFWQTEFQARQFINPSAIHQYLVRTHLHRLLSNSGWEVSGGASWFFNNSNDPKSLIKLTIPELRPHLEFNYKQKFKNFMLDHRYRAESRFFHTTNLANTELENGYNFGNYRFRYRVQLVVDVLKIQEKQLLKFKIGNEFFLNAGKNIILNMFDQNRLYTGLSLQILPNLNLDIGYLKLFQMRTNGGFYDRDIICLILFHKINFI